MVCFDNKLLRGNRTIKNDAGSFAAFISPNFAPIAILEKDITSKIYFDYSHPSLSLSLSPPPVTITDSHSTFHFT